MITEDYISFETAKLLKEKGFVVPYDSFRGVYINGKFLRRNPGQGYLHNMNDEIIDVCSIQMVMKWLREVHHLTIDVFHFRDWKVNIKTIPDDYFKADYSYPELKPAETYEEACEEAIKYCLEKLINNDKNDECEDNADELFAIEQDLGQVLMKSLCAILPYGVIVSDGPAEQRGKLWSVSHDYMVSYESDVSKELERQSIFNVRCYLRSMSNMTEEEKIAYNSLCQHEVDDMGNEWFADTIESFDWLNAHHFDYRGLIKKGRALEAPEDMYD